MDPFSYNKTEIFRTDSNYENIYKTQNINNFMSNNDRTYFENENRKDYELYLKDEIEKRINNKLNFLEFTNGIKEKDILDLMFTFHDVKSEAEKLKMQMNEKTIFSQTQTKQGFFSRSNKNTNCDTTIDLNRSTFSNITKRSNSSNSKSSTKNSFATGEVKTRFGAQRITINIEGNINTTPNKTKKEINKIEVLNHAKLLEKNLKPNVHEIKSVKNLMIQTTFKNLNKSQPKISKNLEDTNLSISMITANTNRIKNPFELKYPILQNIKSSNQNINSTVDTNKIPLSPNNTRPSFKFEPKKKNPSGSGMKINPTNLFNNFTQPEILNIKSSFKSESSHFTNNNLNQDEKETNSNSRNTSGTFKKIFGPKSIISVNETVNNFLNDKNNIPLLNNIYEFLNHPQDKINFKNVSILPREIYLENQIKNLDKIIEFKSKQENPLYNVEITNEDFFNKILILSKEKSKFYQDEGFVNLVIVLFIILKNPNSLEIVIQNLNLEEMIEIIESNIIDRNIYSKYKEIINNLKSSKGVYLLLKQIKNYCEGLFYEHIIEFLYNLTNEQKTKFSVLIELVISIKSLLENGPNLEVIIDIEILNHKLGLLRNYKNKL